MTYLDAGRDSKDGCFKSDTNASADDVSEQGELACRKPCSPTTGCCSQAIRETSEAKATRSLLLGMPFQALAELEIGIGTAWFRELKTLKYSNSPCFTG